MSKKTIALCFFGVIPRSIRYTFNSIKRNIIDVIKDDDTFDLKIYVFNLNIENTLIDGVNVSQDDVKIINADYYEEFNQNELDNNELTLLRKKINVRFRDNYSNTIIQNALRQMYSEYRVGCFLRKHKFDIGIVCGPDFYIANKIDINEIKYSLLNNKILYGTIMNDGQGYTNGFYFGNTNNLIKILTRYEHLNRYLPTDKDYEYILQRSFIDNNIIRQISKIVFFKIRANKNAHMSSIIPNNLTNDEIILINQQRRSILNKDFK